jgi:hypothetical protein
MIVSSREDTTESGRDDRNLPRKGFPRWLARLIHPIDSNSIRRRINGESSAMSNPDASPVTSHVLATLMAFLATLFVGSGCASSPGAEDVLNPPQAGEAIIVFMRPSSMAGAD